MLDVTQPALIPLSPSPGPVAKHGQLPLGTITPRYD